MLCIYIYIYIYIYMTTHGKTDHFTHFVKNKLLVSLECALDDELIGAFDTVIRRSITKS